MSQDQTLSGEEISALMSEARESGPGEGSASAGPARAFSLGGDAGRTMAAIPALDRLNERMVKRLRDVIEPFARVKPRVSTLPTEVRAFGDWRAEQSEFVSLSLYGFRPLKGAILLRIEPEFISRLVDAFYGGNGTAPSRRGREFTATEESLLGRLAEAMIGALAEVWQEVVPVRPLLKGRETNVGFADLAGADEAVAVTRFDVAPWAGPGSAIEILYPVAALRSVEPELAEGSIVELDRQSHELLDIMANGTLIARGEVVTVNGRFGIRVVEVVATEAGIAGTERRK